MRRTDYFFILFWMIAFSSVPLLAWGQDKQAEAKEQLKIYRNAMAQGKDYEQGYEALYNAYGLYKDLIENSQEGSEDFAASKTALKDIFEGLCEAIYYFFDLERNSGGSKNYAEKYTRMGVAYVDISQMLYMKDEHLAESENYLQLLAFTARAAENIQDYEKAVLLNQAYLDTQDQQNRVPVMQSLAMSQLALGHYDDFKSVCEAALKEHPEDRFLASKAYRVCRDQKDENGMAVFGEFYARFDPAMKPVLLWNKGKYLDEQQQFIKAVEIWKQLDSISSDNADVYLRLGFDNYNAGVQCIQAAGAEENGREQNLAKARSFFSTALPYLDDISKQSAYRKAANVATAIASCHAIIGDEKALKEDNDWLASLGANEVKKEDTPQLQIEYKPVNANPVAKPTPPPTSPKITSDVDQDLPKSERENKNTYVVIFGNEVYPRLENINVKFAKNDAQSFKKYCTDVLGIPEHHVRLDKDASQGTMQSQLRFIEKTAKHNPGTLRFLVYYAGHGTQDEDRNPYLLPCDADGSDMKACISLKEMTAKLEELPTKGVTLFLDACFTGFSPEGKGLVDGRFVAFAPKKTEVNKNLVVFSATSQKQRALPFDEQGHGYFTYFLLKNLKESKGRITYGDLADKLQQQVWDEANARKNMEQTPEVNVSKALENSWRSMTFLE